MPKNVESTTSKTMENDFLDEEDDGLDYDTDSMTLNEF